MLQLSKNRHIHFKFCLDTKLAKILQIRVQTGKQSVGRDEEAAAETGMESLKPSAIFWQFGFLLFYLM